MHTRLYAGTPLKQDSFERAQALGLEGKMGGTDGTGWNGTGRTGRHLFCPFITNKTELSVFFTPTVCMSRPLPLSNEEIFILTAVQQR